MANWCSICGRKLKADYGYFKQRKAHRICIKQYKLQIQKEKETQNDKTNSL